MIATLGAMDDMSMGVMVVVVGMAAEAGAFVSGWACLLDSSE